MSVSDGRLSGGGPIRAEETATYRRMVMQFPTISISVYNSDGDTIAEWVGEDVARMCGYEVEELEAEPDLWLNIVHPADREKITDIPRRLASSQQAREDYRIYRKDGQMKWVSDVRLAASAPREGQLTSIRCVTDITAAKSVDQEIVDFKELVNETPVAITVRDLSEHMLYCNNAAARLYGAPEPSAMLGTTFADIMAPEFLTPFRERMLPMILTGPWASDVFLVRKDGTVIEVKAATNLFRDNNGLPVAFYSILTDITPLKQTERALRANEELLKTVQDSLTVNLAVIDREGTIISVNERWKRFARENGDDNMDHTCEGVNYLDVCRRATGSDSEGAQEALDGLLAVLGDESSEFEMEYACPSRTQSRWFFMRAAPLTEAYGGAVVAHIDITERKRAEEALRESKESYQSLLHNLDAVVFRMDENGNAITVSGRVQELLGWNSQEFEKYPALWRELLHPEDIDKFWEVMRIARASCMPQNLELRIIRRTGETRWYRGTITPIFDEDREFLYFDGISFDVTRLRFAEEARKESEQKLRSIMNSVDAVIFRMDPNLKLLALLGNVTHCTGYTIGEMLTDPSLWGKSILHPDDAERVRAFYKETAATAETRAVEMRILNKNGTVHWVRSQVTPRYDGDGNLLHFDGVGLDITESKENQARETRRTARMHILTDISQLFASTLDAQQIFDMATHHLCVIFQCPCVGITIAPSSGHIRRVSVCCPDHCEIESLDVALRHLGLSIDEVFGPWGITPGIVEDVVQSSRAAEMFVECVLKTGSGPIRSAMMAPVAEGQEATGILMCGRTTEDVFDSEDLWFLTEIAAHASAALATAALYKRQAHIAETLQRSLVPDEPHFKHLDIATLYAPAPGEAEVGGDFFDVFSVDHDKVAIVVGDVSGKGLQAAIHTAETKYMLRGFAHQNHDPHYVVHNLNHALNDYLPNETFITLLYFIIDTKNHTMTYINAGHEAPILFCRDSNSVGEIKPCGPVLGVTKSAIYTTQQAVIEPDDTLFCYTDGVTDVRTNGDRFGYARLRECVVGAPPGSAHRVMEHVMGKVRSFGLSRQTDDQVVVVVRLLV